MDTGWPQAIDELLTILVEGKDMAARLAVAEAIAQTDSPSTRFIEPLLVLLGDSAPELRQAAAAALANYKDSGVAARLGQLSRDGQAGFAQRLAAVEALKRINDRTAIEPLIALLDDANAEIIAKAIDALHTVTGVDHGQEPSAWKEWWRQNRSKTRYEWITDINEALSRRNNALRRELDLLRGRLREALTQHYQVRPESERPNLLLTWLKDPLAEVRVLALDLALEAAADRRPVGSELAAQIRQMVADPAPDVRKAVMVLLRYPPPHPDDAKLVASRLADETDSEVKQSILVTLGTRGDRSVLDAVVGALSDASPAVAAEAAASLASLADRGQVDAPELAAAGDVLRERLKAIAPDSWALRKRFIEAMSRLADGQFRDVFLAHMINGEHPAVRQVAVRGLSGLAGPQSIEPLVDALDDPDAGVRLAAAEGLSRVGGPEQLTVLFRRLEADREPAYEVRGQVWKSFLSLVGSGKVDDQLTWLKRVDPTLSDEWATRYLELVQILEGKLVDRPNELMTLLRQSSVAAAKLGKSQLAAQRASAAYDLAIASNDLQADRLAAMAIEHWLRADQEGIAVEAASKMLGNSTPARTDAVLTAFCEHIDRLIATGTGEQARSLVQLLRDELGDLVTDEWDKRLTELAGRATTTQATLTQPVGS
ncbi:MAG TPA: HEAT repeat domain-containing protein [Phycisphaerae bacterium]|nr:HEAT repeat domain-containing protein [Phycisphaerae bacterium]